MSYDSNLNAYLQSMWSAIQAQTAQINALEATVRSLEKEVAALKEQRTIHIEKIEYNFDQLKVEQLEGVLNIGFSPDVGKSIEEFTVGSVSPTITPAAPPVLKPVSAEIPETEVQQKLQESMLRYLDTEVPYEINEIGKRRQYNFDQDYIAFIVEDLKRQIDDRIVYYLGSVSADPDQPGAEPLFDAVTARVKRDIRVGIENYLRKLPPNGSGSE